MKDKVIGYDSIDDVSINDANGVVSGGGVSVSVPGVNSEKIDATASVYNIPEQEFTSIEGWTTNITWSATDYNTVSWSSGSIYLPDGTVLSVSSGNTGNMSGVTYIYYDRTNNTVGKTTTPQNAVGSDKILICTAKPNSDSSKKAEYQAMGTEAQNTFITADNIAANTITSNELAANSVTATQISVSSLDAISANMGTITAGTITGVTITGATIRTASSGKRFEMTSSEIAYYDNNAMRIQFTGNGFEFYNENGSTAATLYGYRGSSSYRGLVLDKNLTMGGDLSVDGSISTSSGDISATNGTITGDIVKGTDGVHSNTFYNLGGTKNISMANSYPTWSNSSVTNKAILIADNYYAGSVSNTGYIEIYTNNNNYYFQIPCRRAAY